jgi:hypothetical protein
LLECRHFLEKYSRRGLSINKSLTEAVSIHLHTGWRVSPEE